jgi:hypothetical protein
MDTQIPYAPRYESPERGHLILSGFVRRHLTPRKTEHAENEAYAESEHESWLRTAAAGLRGGAGLWTGDRRPESFHPANPRSDRLKHAMTQAGKG